MTSCRSFALGKHLLLRHHRLSLAQHPGQHLRHLLPLLESLSLSSSGLHLAHTSRLLPVSICAGRCGGGRAEAAAQILECWRLSFLGGFAYLVGFRAAPLRSHRISHGTANTVCPN